jgi:hypothetical protein
MKRAGSDKMALLHIKRNIDSAILDLLATLSAADNAKGHLRILEQNVGQLQKY